MWLPSSQVITGRPFLLPTRVSDVLIPRILCPSSGVILATFPGSSRLITASDSRAALLDALGIVGASCSLIMATFMPVLLAVTAHSPTHSPRNRARERAHYISPR